MKRKSRIKETAKGLCVWLVIWGVILLGSLIQYG